MTSILFLLMVGGYGAGTVSALCLGQGRIGRGLTGAGAMLGGAAGMGLALHVLATGAVFDLDLRPLLTLAGGFALRLDRLGAFFLGVVSLVAVPSALYGAGYSAVYQGRRSLPLLGVMLNLFLLDRKSTRLNSSHTVISYAVFC